MRTLQRRRIPPGTLKNAHKYRYMVNSVKPSSCWRAGRRAPQCRRIPPDKLQNAHKYSYILNSVKPVSWSEGRTEGSPA
jgi:hypothetical protein